MAEALFSSDSTMEWTFCASLFISSVMLLLRYLSRPRSLSLPVRPPGPRGFPLVGIAFKMPHSSPWKTFHKWSKRFGRLVW